MNSTSGFDTWRLSMPVFRLRRCVNLICEPITLVVAYRSSSVWQQCRTLICVSVRLSVCCPSISTLFIFCLSQVNVVKNSSGPSLWPTEVSYEQYTGVDANDRAKVCMWLQICEDEPCGIQTRPVICTDPLGNCDLMSMPAVEQRCSNATCGTWQLGPWSMVCAANCLYTYR